MDNRSMQHSTIAETRLSTVSPTAATDGKLHEGSRESGCPSETHTGHQTPVVCSVIKHPVTVNTSNTAVNNASTQLKQTRDSAASIIVPSYQKPSHQHRTGAVADANLTGYYIHPTTVMQKHAHENEHTSSVPTVRLEAPQPAQLLNPAVTTVDSKDVSAFGHGVTPVALNRLHDLQRSNADQYTVSVQTFNTDTHDITTCNTNSTPIEKNHTSIQSSAVSVGAAAVATTPTTKPLPDVGRQSAQPVEWHIEVPNSTIPQGTVKNGHENLSVTINQPRNDSLNTCAVTVRKRNQPGAQASAQADTTVLSREKQTNRRNPRTAQARRTSSTISSISTPDPFSKPRPLQAPKIHASSRAKPEEWNRSDSLQKRRRLLPPTSQYIKD